jgi:outer membrane protein assembly factor BamD
MAWSCKDPLEAIRRNPDKSVKLQKAFEFYEKKDWEKAQVLFEDLIPLYRGSVEAEKIYFAYANTHFYTRNYTFSSYYFKQFYNTYPNSDKAEEALYNSALSSYQVSPSFRLTQEDTDKAIESFQLFANTFPLSSRLPECNAKIDELRAKLQKKDMENAQGYFHRKQYKAALNYFNALLEKYPETTDEEYIKYMVVSAAYRYAEASILEKQLERYEEAEELYQRFARKISKGKYAKNAESIHQNCIQKIKKLRNERN